MSVMSLKEVGKRKIELTFVDSLCMNQPGPVLEVLKSILMLQIGACPPTYIADSGELNGIPNILHLMSCRVGSKPWSIKKKVHLLSFLKFSLNYNFNKPFR